jgi:hypothetical protein
VRAVLLRSDIFGVRNSTNGALERRLGDIEHTFGTVRAAKKRSRIRGTMVRNFEHIGPQIVTTRQQVCLGVELHIPGE